MQALKSTVVNILIYLHVKLKGTIRNCMCNVHSLIHSFVHANIVSALWQALGHGHTAANNTDKTPCLHGACILVRGDTINI